MLRAQVTALDQIETLQREWSNLEAKVAPTPFLRWPWIGTWLATLADMPLVLRVWRGDEIVAMGLFHRATERRRFLRVRQLHLNATGDQAKDIITIEYNTLLCDPSLEAAVWPVALAALSKSSERWDELVVSGATEATASILMGLGQSTHCRAETTSAFVDLAALRAGGIADLEGYIATLGKSTRSQIRRALKLYAERGEVKLEAAQTPAQAARYFDECGALHEAKWSERGGGGAFSNAPYLRFHRAMLASHLSSVEVLRASAGGEAFGYLYNLVDDSRALFYLSGFAFEDDNRLKPGLVTQALAVERHVQAGRDVYDFMGGGDRYKSNLGQSGPGIVSLAIQRLRLGLTVERNARYLKARLSEGAATRSNKSSNREMVASHEKPSA